MFQKSFVVLLLEKCVVRKENRTSGLDAMETTVTVDKEIISYVITMLFGRNNIYSS